MAKSKLNNLELVHLNIWLNMMQKYGDRICDKWTNKNKGYLNFKIDSFKQFLNHVEQFGVYKTFIGLQDPHGQFAANNCFWSTEEVDYTEYEYRPPKTKIRKFKKSNRQNNKDQIKTKVLNIKDFKKKS